MPDSALSRLVEGPLAPGPGRPQPAGPGPADIVTRARPVPEPARVPQVRDLLASTWLPSEAPDLSGPPGPGRPEHLPSATGVELPSSEPSLPPVRQPGVARPPAMVATTPTPPEEDAPDRRAPAAAASAESVSPRAGAPAPSDPMRDRDQEPGTNFAPAVARLPRPETMTAAPLLLRARRDPPTPAPRASMRAAMPARTAPPPPDLGEGRPVRDAPSIVRAPLARPPVPEQRPARTPELGMVRRAQPRRDGDGPEPAAAAGVWPLPRRGTDPEEITAAGTKALLGVPGPGAAPETTDATTPDRSVSVQPDRSATGPDLTPEVIVSIGRVEIRSRTPAPPRGAISPRSHQIPPGGPFGSA